MSPLGRNAMKAAALKRLFFSVRSRVAVFALAATVAPTLTLGWISHQRNAAVLTQKTAHELESATAIAAREIDLWLRDRVEEMRVFGSSYLVTENLEPAASSTIARGARRQSGERIHDYLASVASRFPGFSSLQVVSAKGTTVYGGKGRAPELPNGWLGSVVAGKTVIGTPVWRDDTESVGVGIAVPVRSGRGETLGALIANVDAQAIGAMLERTALTDGFLYLVNDGGQRIRSRASEPAAGQVALRSAIVPNHVAEYSNDRGQAMIGSLRPIAGLGWSVVAERPRSIVFAELDAVRNTTLQLLALLLVGVGIGAYWIGLSIVHPLDRLVAAANRVAGGDLDLTVPIRQRDELGHLTERFNEMTAQLRHAREELADANDALIRKNIELEAISITDALTSLYNRRHLLEVLDREFQQHTRSGSPFTMLMVDLDHFKRINDTYGHPAGDAVLIAAARVMRDAIRGVDYAARFGGEEFVLLLTGTGAQEAETIAERIRLRIAENSVLHNETRISVTASIGLAEVQREGDSPSALIARADAALYDAKESGRNRVVRHQAKVHVLHTPGKKA